MNTLIVYDNKYEEVKHISQVFSYVLGPSKKISIEKFDGDFRDYNNILIVTLVHSDKFISKVYNFINLNIDELKSKKIAFICIMIDRKNIGDFSKNVENVFGRRIDWYECFKIPIDDNLIVDKALELKRAFNDSRDMPLDILKQQIKNFIISHNTCTLSTGHENCIRSTPIEYLYLGDRFYFISEGGEKFAHIYLNPNVSISIYDDYKDFEHLSGIQVSGSAKIGKRFSREYDFVMKNKGLDISKLEKMPVNLNIIKVIPYRYEILLSSFKKNGYNVKQVLNLKSKL